MTLGSPAHAYRCTLQPWATVVKVGRARCGCAWQLLRIAKLRTRDQRRADWRSLRLLELFLMFLLWQHWVGTRACATRRCSPTRTRPLTPSQARTSAGLARTLGEMWAGTAGYVCVVCHGD